MTPLNRRHWMRTLVFTTAGVGIGLAGPARPAAAQPGDFRTITWEDLVPEGWDPFKDFQQKNPVPLREGDPRERELMREMRKIWDRAPIRDDLVGARVRLPGYAVPLEMAKGEIKEFLLVPYFGACIHSPPPPANQIIHVVLARPHPVKTMQAVWASGTLKAERTDSAMGTSGYRMDGHDVQPYKAPER